MVVCAFSFFCFLIAFNSGEMRTFFVVDTFVSFLIYLALFHRIAEFSTSCLTKVKKKRLKKKKSKKLQKNSEKV